MEPVQPQAQIAAQEGYGAVAQMALAPATDAQFTLRLAVV